MKYSDEFRRCLIDGDVVGITRLWAHVSPHLPQPSNQDEAWIMLHRARTEAKSVPFKLRAYSHAWMTERGYPSGLPDHLRPRAERIYPVIRTGVGISVNFRTPEFKPVGVLVRQAMSDAVEEAYADGKTDTPFVRQRMAEARTKTLSKLIGK